MPSLPEVGLRRRLSLLYGVAAVVYVLDRVTKVAVETTLAGRPPVEVIPGVLRLRFTTNPGGAFGLFGGAPVLFLVASVIAVVVIVAASRRVAEARVAVGLGLVLAGALGNLTDRMVRGNGLDGSVVDFIDFRVWPVFNVADVAIVVGAVLLLLGSVRRERDEPERP